MKGNGKRYRASRNLISHEAGAARHGTRGLARTRQARQGKGEGEGKGGAGGRKRARALFPYFDYHRTIFLTGLKSQNRPSAPCRLRPLIDIYIAGGSVLLGSTIKSGYNIFRISSLRVLFKKHLTTPRNRKNASKTASRHRIQQVSRFCGVVSAYRKTPPRKGSDIRD